MLKLHDIEGLGTIWWIEIYDADHDEVLEQLIIETIRLFESNYSRFIDDSIISILNRTGIIERPSKELLEILSLGITYFKSTTGIFDFSLGRESALRGYDTQYSLNYSPKLDNVKTVIKEDIDQYIHMSSKRVELNDCSIDIGGYGKGYLIDKITRLIIESGYESFLINGGGDIYATSHNGLPIEIHLEDPFNPGNYFAKAQLLNVALCASSPVLRRWFVDDATVSHLIDPTDIKSDKQIAAIATAKNAVDADMAATLLSLGCDGRVIKSVTEEYTIEYMILADGKAKVSSAFPLMR